MALTDPINIHTPPAFAAETGESPRPEIAIRPGDLRRVRLFYRLAAVLKALVVSVILLITGWLLAWLLDWSWLSGWMSIALFVALPVAVYLIMTELRLRSYDVELTSRAVIFEYGRRRSYVPLEHIQLVDTESTILLRRFDLRRCNLHTGGGMVIVSPVPARVASAIERSIYEQHAVSRADRTHASS